MSATVLSKLEEILAGLTGQEESLSTQLKELSAKREAIRGVIDQFGVADSSTAKPTTTAKKTIAKKTTRKQAAKKTSAKKTARKQAATKTVSSKTTTKAKAAKPKAKSNKKDGRTATWQKYTLPGVGKHPMPEAVRLILATQPEKDFKIAEVMAGLFKESMPKNQYLKARNRISNILSGGVRDGQWFKGDRGAYRLTAA
ncbi:MAG: hypothetical protein AAFR58_07515 [Cyanobacteria bacterium J06627_28]